MINDFGHQIPFGLWLVLFIENAIRVISGIIAGVILYKAIEKRRRKDEKRKQNKYR